jgi:hypothetical protein
MATIARINEVIVAIAFSLQVKKKKNEKKKRRITNVLLPIL